MSIPSSQLSGNPSPIKPNQDTDASGVDGAKFHGKKFTVSPDNIATQAASSSSSRQHSQVELDTVLAAVAVLKNSLDQSDLDPAQPYLKDHLAVVEQFAQALQGNLKVSMAGSVQKLFRSERERLRKIVQPMQSATTIDQLFKATVAGLGETLRVSRVMIYRCAPEDQGKVMVEALASGWTPTKNEVLPLSFFGFDGANPDVDGSDWQSHWQQTKHQVRVLAHVNELAQGNHSGEYLGAERLNGNDEGNGSGAIKIATVSPYQKQLYERFQVQALMAVPILFGTANGAAGYNIDPLTEQDLTQMEMWGILGVHQCDRPRQWSEMDISLLQQVSRELTLCLQPAEFRTQLRLRTDQERLVGRVVNKLYQSSNIQHLFDLTVREIRRSLGADRVAIFQFHPDSNYKQGQFIAEDVVAGSISVMTAPIHDAHWLASGLTAYQDGQTLAVSDIMARDASGAMPDSPDAIDVLNAYEVRANLVVPLLEDRVLWGVLCVQQCRGPRQWKEAEIDLVRSIASQFTVALQQAVVTEQLQQKSEALTRQIERQNVLIQLIPQIGFSLSERIRQSATVEFTLKNTIKDLRNFYEADRVVVYRFNEDWSGQIVAESVGAGWVSLLELQEDDATLQTDLLDSDRCSVKRYGSPIKADSDTYLKDTKGGRYTQGAMYTSVDDVAAMNFPECYRESLAKFQAKAYLNVPIFNGTHLWGLLVIHHCQGVHQWEPVEIDLLVQVGRQLGLSIQQAEYVEQVQRQAQKLTELAAAEKAAKETVQHHAIKVLTAVRPALHGDLTVRAPITDDEIGTIASLYNNTLQSLQQLVAQVQATAIEVTAATDSSAQKATGLAQKATEQLQSIQATLSQVQAMVAAINESSTYTQSVETAIAQAETTLQEGDTAMNLTVGNIASIRDTVADTAKRVKALAESSQKISRVVQLISNFASQTNLLSLNASLEATRAGEYGRGFAVVADEVRSLARQSAAATVEIEKLVLEIQSETSAVTKAMDRGIERVVEGTTLVQQTRQNLLAISTATGEIRDLLRNLTQSAQSQQEQAQVVTGTIHTVAEIAHSNSHEAIAMADLFKELLTLAQNLQTSVDCFKVDH
ncbi:MAG: GAF domain-containing protein [Pseudanabaena sp. ELA607]